MAEIIAPEGYGIELSVGDGILATCPGKPTLRFNKDTGSWEPIATEKEEA